MKKSLLLWIMLIVFVLSIMWVLIYLRSEGEFKKISHITVGDEVLKERKAVYLSYHFRWEGISNPTLKKVEFIKNDGTITAKVEDQILIKPYISKVDFGSYYEEEVIKEGIVNTLLPVLGYKPDDDFSLVFRVEINDPNWNDDIGTIRITYKKWGQTQFQNIPFADGLITEE
jgi:hypothetical protein